MIGLILLLLILVIAVPAAFKQRVSTAQNFNQGVSIFDDFLEPNTNTVSLGYTGQLFTSYQVGIGAATNNNIVPVDYYPGYVQLSTTNANDSVSLYAPSAVVQPSNNVVLAIETRYEFLVLPAAGNSVETFFGLSSLETAGGRISQQSNSAAFLIDKSVSNFYIAYLQAPGYGRQVVTAVPINLADTYLKIAITPTSVYYYINNVLVATIIRSIAPTVRFFPAWSMVAYASAGAGPRCVLSADAIGLYQQFNSPRKFSNTVLTQ